MVYCYNNFIHIDRHINSGIVDVFSVGLVTFVFLLLPKAGLPTMYLLLLAICFDFSFHLLTSFLWKWNSTDFTHQSLFRSRGVLLHMWKQVIWSFLWLQREPRHLRQRGLGLNTAIFYERKKEICSVISTVVRRKWDYQTSVASSTSLLDAVWGYHSHCYNNTPGSVTVGGALHCRYCRQQVLMRRKNAWKKRRYLWFSLLKGSAKSVEYSFKGVKLVLFVSYFPTKNKRGYNFLLTISKFLFPQIHGYSTRTCFVEPPWAHVMSFLIKISWDGDDPNINLWKCKKELTLLQSCGNRKTPKENCYFQEHVWEYYLYFNHNDACCSAGTLYPT